MLYAPISLDPTYLLWTSHLSPLDISPTFLAACLYYFTCTSKSNIYLAVAFYPLDENFLSSLLEVQVKISPTYRQQIAQRRKNTGLEMVFQLLAGMTRLITIRISSIRSLKTLLLLTSISHIYTRTWYWLSIYSFSSHSLL